MPKVLEPDPVRTRHLLARALAGDRRCEAQLFDSLKGILLREARRHRLMTVVRKTSTEDDVVSEVWLRFYSSGSFAAFEDRGPGSLRSFLCTILDRALVDIVRRAQAEKRDGARRVSSLDGEEGVRAEGPTAAQLPSKDPTPTSRARTAELRRLCRSVLDKSEYEIWRQVELEGRTSIEVAAVLGTTSSAIRGVIHRARFKLIRALESKSRPRP